MILPMVPGDDRGLTLGDGLFETVLALDGRLVWWEAHVARLRAGCAELGLPAPVEAALAAAARAAVTQAGLEKGRSAVRLTWTAGSGGRGLDRPSDPAPRLFATAAPAPLSDGAAQLVISEVRRNEGSPISRLKSLSYADNITARVRARARGADEAVMLNNAGAVACATAANLFWLREGRLVTPALACGVLDGIARSQVIAAAAALGVAVEEVRADAQALLKAEAAFLTNSLMGIRPVSRIEGVELSVATLIGELADRLSY